MTRQKLPILLAIACLLLFTGQVSAKTVKVTINGLSYSPSRVEISEGDTVTWVNDDDADHTITASEGSFSSGKLGSGGSYSHTFSNAGTFSYGCDYHPRMRGTIVVKAKKSGSQGKNEQEDGKSDDTGEKDVKPSPPKKPPG